jgi:hypothetical protein
MNVVEKMAKAIYDQNTYREDKVQNLSWNQLPTSHKKFWCDCAKAGLEALRTPTAEMLDAIYNSEAYYISAAAWRAAIDKALDEKVVK